LELVKGRDHFQARFDLVSGTCNLVRLANGGETKLDSKPTLLKHKGTYRLRFANIDERLILWVDHDLPFGDRVPYETPLERGPFRDDLQPASIGVRGAAVRLQHVKLWRDTYYTNDPRQPDSPALYLPPPRGNEMRAEVRAELHRKLSDAAGFDELRRDMPCRTIYVYPGHYLCLGDNSPESSDGREWGLVPERLLLGRALLSYWPIRRAGPIR
jgi:signal peptidase I